MAATWKKPILIGGLAITAGLWLLDSVNDVLIDVGGNLTWGAIALGGGWFLLRKHLTPAPQVESLPSFQAVDRTEAEAKLTEVRSLLTALQGEGDRPELQSSLDVSRFKATLEAYHSRLTQIANDFERNYLNISVLGTASVGKSCFIKAITAMEPPTGHSPTCHWQEVPLAIASQPTDTRKSLKRPEAPALPLASLTSDLVLFMIAGDVRGSEFQVLKALLHEGQRVLVVFNKEDQYLPEERSLLLQHIQHRVAGMVAAADVVAVSSAPAPLKVRRHQADGQIQETTEHPEPLLVALQTRLDQTLRQEQASLVCGTMKRQGEQLRRDVLRTYNELRRDRALPVIEQSQWIAAAAAFANPIAGLDLLSTAVVSTQLVSDLGAIYGQKLSLDQAKTIATTLAEQMVKLGCVELATRAISPLLKTQVATFAVGGLLEGASAAYLTRMAGLTLLTYFQEKSDQASQSQSLSSSVLDVQSLTQKLKTLFEQSGRTEILKKLVQQTVSNVLPQQA